MIHNAELLNALVAQSDLVYRKVMPVEFGDALLDARNLLDSLEPVWRAVGYGYKADELRKLIKQQAEMLYAVNVGYLAVVRKNDKTRRGVEADQRILEKLI